MTSGPGDDPISSEVDATPEPTPAASGWVVPKPMPGPSGWVATGGSNVPTTKSLRERHPAIRAVVWVAGLLGVVALAAVTARLHGRTGSSAYETGVVVGSLAFGLGVGFVVMLVADRVRRSSGHQPIDWAWTLPLAAALLVLPLASAAGTTSTAATPSPTPRATPLVASSYDKISAPFSLAPTTSADAAIVTQLTASVGSNGISGVSVERVVDSSAALQGYLVVLAVPSASGHAQEFLGGFLDSLSEHSISPTASTIGGRTVYQFSEGQAGEASWLDGDFFVEVFSTNPTTLTSVTKAVLDAH